MKTLFIDTHSEILTLALELDKKHFIKTIENIRSMSEVIMDAIKNILEEHNIVVSDLTNICVVNGPGSFTGVRIGVTIAKVFAHELDIDIKTITSLEALGISESDYFDVIVVEDSKGYYSSLYREGHFTDFEYRKREEFEKYIEENNYIVSRNKNIDISKVLNYVKDMAPINPHSVNPIYIKEIDALK